MPRLISFAETTEQVKNRTKTVTRRKGWKDLQPGTILRGVRKAMGLKKGEKVEDLAIIEVVDVRREPVCAITREDVVLEGFPDWWPLDFITLYCRINDCDADADCTRIQFRYYGVRPCSDGFEGWVVYDLTTGASMGDDVGDIVYLHEADAQRVATAGVCDRMDIDRDEDDDCDEGDGHE